MWALSLLYSAALRNPEAFFRVGVTAAIGYAIVHWPRKPRQEVAGANSLVRYRWVVDTFDALGNAALVVVAVLVALEMRCEPLFLWGPILAVVTAVGGGIMRDVVHGDAIAALKTSPDAEIVVLWALPFSLFFYCESSRLEPSEILAAVMICIAGTFVTRMVAHVRGWRALPF